MYFIKKIFDQGMFQGKYKKRNYFEGWYFKLVDTAEERIIAVIPGVAYSSLSEENKVFIQVIDSKENRTFYFPFKKDEFRFSSKHFHVEIGDNIFTGNKMKLDIRQDGILIQGTLEFHNIIPYPRKLFIPGIMGPFSFLPFMQCYHGVINIQHMVTGKLNIGDNKLDFSPGQGYIEKDWGESFPDWWVWIQSNHFAEEKASFMFSVARIPMLGSHFTGFLLYIYVEGRFFLFTTYNGAKISHLEINKGTIMIKIKNRQYMVEITGLYREGGALKAPRKGIMERRITESVSSDISVILEDHNGNLIYKGQGRNAGIEIVGEKLLFCG